MRPSGVDRISEELQRNLKHFYEIRPNSQKHSLIKNSTDCGNESEINSKLESLGRRRTAINTAMVAGSAVLLAGIVVVGFFGGGANCSSAGDVAFASSIMDIAQVGDLIPNPIYNSI